MRFMEKTETLYLASFRKAWEIVKNIFTGVLFFIAIAMMIFTIISVRTFDRDNRTLFGYRAYIVRSGSMNATDFDAGDLVLVKAIDPTILKAGDIISFRSTDPNIFNEVVTHKIRTLTTDENGNPAFVTYGTTTDVDDDALVTYERILGKYQFALRGIGAFFMFLKTVPGYICCILIPFMFLIIIQGLNSIQLFRQYKEEQMAEIEEKRQKELAEMMAEREKLEAERIESEKKLEELKKLQAEMAEGNEGKIPANPTV